MDLQQTYNNILTGGGQLLSNIGKGVSSAIGNVAHTFQQPVQSQIPQGRPLIQTPLANMQPINYGQVGSNMGKFIGSQPILNNVTPFKLPSPTINQAAQTLAPNSAISAFTQGKNPIPPLMQTLQHEGEIAKAMGTPTNQLTPQQIQLQKEGVGNFALGMLNGGSNDIKKATQYLRTRLDPEAANVLTKFVSDVQTKGPAAQIENSPTVQAIAHDVFGPQSATWGNQKLANVLDTVLSSVGKEPNKAGLGLSLDEIKHTKAGGVNEFAGPQVEKPTEPLPWETGSGTQMPDLGTVDKKTGGIIPPSKTPSGTIQDALGQRFNVQQSISQRANVLSQIVDKAVTGPEETALFRNSVEHPDNLVSNAQKVANPEAFKEAVGKFGEFTDFVHGTAKQNGLKLGYLQDYYSHIIDLSNPVDQQRFQELMSSTSSKGYFTKDRIFKNIDDLENAGFKLKNPNVPLDIKQYGNSAIRSIGNSALVKGVGKAAPGEVIKISELGYIPRDSQGNNFVASKIPGLEDFAFSPNVQKSVQHLETAPESNGILKAYDTLNSLGKEVSLAGGGFHALKTTLRQVGTQLLNFKIPRLDEAFVNAISPAARLAYRERAIADGTIDKASQMGVTLDTVRDVGQEGFLKKAKALNPLSNLHNSLFGGLINTYKLQLVRNANVEGLNPQQQRQLGAQINNLMGGLNYDLIRRSPVTQQWLRRGLLAPDFNEGKLRQVATALKPTLGADANFARKAIIGEALAVGILAEVGRKLVTGQFSQGLLPALQNDIINPNIPTNMKDTKGRALAAGLPGSTIADISRAGVGSLVQGNPDQAGQDLGQFIQARGSSAISAGTKLVTGKDYYGNPLVKNGEDNLVNRAGAVIPNMLPIPVVQGQKVLQGQNSIPTAIINTLGGRVHIDPNDPTYQSEQRYFQAKDTQYKALTPGQQKLVDAIPKQDPTDPGAKQLKYELIGRDPAVWNYFKNIATADANGDTNKIDPLYTVPYEVAKKYILYESQNPGSADKSALYKANPEIGQIAGQRAVYFQNNPVAGQTNANPAPVASPYVQQQMNAKNWKDPQVKAYLDANTQYNNGLRSQLGLTAINNSFGPKKPSIRSLKNPKLNLVKPKGIAVRASRGGSYTLKAPKLKIAAMPRFGTSLPKAKKVKLSA